jgi:hypothetical protein
MISCHGDVLPFVTQMLGVLVTVEAVDLTEDERIVVICSRGEHRQRVPILDLPSPDPAPKGTEWVEAYRAWSNGSWPIRLSQTESLLPRLLPST